MSAVAEVFFELEAPYLGRCQLRAVRLGTGPIKVAVVAGVHGNEVTAIYAANLLLERLSAFDPVSLPGILVVPCVNEAGTMLGIKRWPFDEVDLQEAFPGDAQGNAANRLAAAVLEITKAQLGIELQTGSEVLEEGIHVRGYDEGLVSGLNGLWWKEVGSSDLVSCWQARGQRALALRGGRAGSLDPTIAMTLAGMAEQILLPDVSTRMTASIRKITPVELRAEGAGFFVPCVQTGQSVVEGAVVGEVRPLVGGQAGIKVFAPVSGTIIAVRCYPTVHIRELLVRIGVPV